MAKKRPRIKPRRPWNRVRAELAREHVEYWRGRLFKNTFTYKGRRFHVNHWSVKIQHRGARKTLQLLGHPFRFLVAPDGTLKALEPSSRESRPAIPEKNIE